MVRDLAIAAHGGLDRWSRIESVDARVAVSGALFELKGYPAGLGGTVEVSADTGRPRATVVPLPNGAEGFFDGNRVVITPADGRQEGRDGVRASFAGLAPDAPWDDFQLLYFAGYAMWNYLLTPFLLRWPGFKLEEVAPWREAGETWRRLRAEFPADIPTHCPEQTFYFDERGLLRRLDYSPEVVGIQGSVGAAHYCDDHETFSGLVVPTRRRVFLRRDDGTPVTGQPVVEIEVEDVIGKEYS